MKRLLGTIGVALVVTVAVLFGVRAARHYFRHAPSAEEKTLAIKPEVNVSIDINVTDIVAAAAGGAFAWRKMHRRKRPEG